jgi:hypothetical protein
VIRSEAKNREAKNREAKNREAKNREAKSEKPRHRALPGDARCLLPSFFVMKAKVKSEEVEKTWQRAKHLQASGEK